MRNLVAQSCDLEMGEVGHSTRRNAVMPDKPVKARAKKHASNNLSMSTYVRNDNAFSVLQKDIATGQSKLLKL